MKVNSANYLETDFHLKRLFNATTFQSKMNEIQKLNRPKFDAIKALNLPLGQYSIGSSGAFGIRNLRSINDIDIIVTEKLWDILAKQYGITTDNGFNRIIFPDGIVEAISNSSFFEDRNTPSIITRTANADIIDDLPFETLDDVIHFKQKMGREKDLSDILLIKSY